MKTHIVTIFCLLAGLLSVNLFVAPDATAEKGPSFTCPDGSPGTWFEGENGLECLTGVIGLVDVIASKCTPRDTLYSSQGAYKERPARCELRVHGEINSKEECESLNGDAHDPTGRSVHFWDEVRGCQHAAVSRWYPDFPEEFLATVLATVLAEVPLLRGPDDIQSGSVPASDAVAGLGIQAAGYVISSPVSDQQIMPSSEKGSAVALGLVALPVAMLAGWHILSPDEWSAPSFGFSGNLTDSFSNAVGRMSAQRGSLSAYADAHLSRGATTEYVGGAEYRAARWLSFSYTAHAREGKPDADLVFGAVADRRVGDWLFTAGADTDVGARAQAVLSLGR